MKRFFILTVCLMIFNFFAKEVNAQDLDQRFLNAIKSLENKFGTVLPQSITPQTCSLSFSAPYAKIDELIASVDGNGVQIEKITVFGRDQEIAAISLALKCGDNMPKLNTTKVSAFYNLCKTPTIPWTSTKSANNKIIVSTIETTFEDTVTIKGITDKSGLVFSDLFPILNDIRSISAPFFERGTFFDTEEGRKMEFTLQCKWGTKF